MSERYAHLALRVGTAFAFLYPPISAFSDPDAWTGYFPSFLLNVAGTHELWLLHAFGVVEVIIAVWILSGWKIRIPSAVATVILVAIVAFNLPNFPLLFRDLSIAAMTLVLALWPVTESPSRPL